MYDLILVIILISEYILKNKTVILDENLTYYRQTKTNISSKFKFLSRMWWIRRYQAQITLNFFSKVIKFLLNLILIMLLQK